jgi:hypothetical protein
MLRQNRLQRMVLGVSPLNETDSSLPQNDSPKTIWTGLNSWFLRDS